MLVGNKDTGWYQTNGLDWNLKIVIEYGLELNMWAGII